MNTGYEFSLMQLADSFFPYGNFALSGGLEALVKAGRIKNSKDIGRFLQNQLHFQLEPFDCIILSLSYDSSHNSELMEITNLDNLLFSSKIVEAVRTSSIRSGLQFLDCVIAMVTETKELKNNKLYQRKKALKFANMFRTKVKSKAARGTFPVCLSISANLLGIPKQSAIRIFLYSYLASTVGAAVRMGIIQHVTAQSIIASLRNECESISNSVMRKTINDVWQSIPLVEILQMRHEKDDLRMFIT
ncbi:MAG TPA: urease accessory UreF family protein [Nitrososphaeraceae archaeon]|nr:urease accessory UreF family protein [Nitrososphaeraceae archaeon]